MNSIAQRWLNLQCESIDQACAGLFLLVAEDRRKLDIAARWPQDSQEPLECLAVSRLAIKNHHYAVSEKSTSPLRPEGLFDYLAWPIYIDDKLAGVASVKIPSDGDRAQKDALRALQIGSRWLALPQGDAVDQKSLFQTVTAVAVECLAKDSFQAAVINLCQQMASRFQAERVALGWCHKGRSQLVALSNSIEQQNKSKLIRTIEAAMDDVLDQDRTLCFPAPDGEQETLSFALGDLARKFGNAHVLGLPLVFGGEVVAVMIIERAQPSPFNDAEIMQCEQILAMVSSYLTLKFRDEKAISRKLFDSLSDSLRSLVGYEHLGVKLSLLSLLLLVGFATIKSGDFRVSADAVLEGSLQRSIPAPMDGFIKAAQVRSGDTIEEGDLIAQMDDREIRLEVKRIDGQLQQLQREYREAMATRELVQVRVLDAQIKQVETRLELERNKLQRTAIVAPFNAFVIDGDLSQSLGAPVERGEVLFRIAPLDGYRVILKINERDITHIRHGQAGELTLASLPDRRFALKVEKITQVARAEDNSNIFRVEASLADAPQLLRPGMEGVGKVDIGRRKLLWIWLRDAIDQVRLWTWSVWP